MAKQIGLNNPDIDFNYNLIKGKLAENIIEQLFQALKFKVYPYGIENVIPDFRLIKEKDYGKQKDETIESIKNTPDYFVCSDELGKFLIEVKYRSNGKLEFEIFEDYPFPLVYVLFVTKSKIKITTVKKIEAELKKKKQSQKILEDLHETNLINFDDEQRIIIEQFYSFVEYFFKNLPSNNEAQKALERTITTVTLKIK